MFKKKVITSCACGDGMPLEQYGIMMIELGLHVSHWFEGLLG